MKLGLINYNRGQMPATIKAALTLCTIYNRKDIIEYLSQNEKGIHKVNCNGYVFGFCCKEYQKELQEYTTERYC
jgi:hypothetical protein